MYRVCCGTLILLVGLACTKSNTQASDSSIAAPNGASNGVVVPSGDSVVVTGGDSVIITGGDSVVVTGGDTVVVTGGDTIKVNGRGTRTPGKNIVKCRFTVTWNQPANETRKKVVFLTCRPRP
jgi:hypothetical protein